MNTRIYQAQTLGHSRTDHGKRQQVLNTGGLINRSYLGLLKYVLTASQMDCLFKMMMFREALLEGQLSWKSDGVEEFRLVLPLPLTRVIIYDGNGLWYNEYHTSN